MRYPLAPDSIASFSLRKIRNAPQTTRLAWIVILMMFGSTGVACSQTVDQANRFVIERENRTIVLEPYGANIIRITLSTTRTPALAAPGYGIEGRPSMAGWTREKDSEGYDVIRSGQMTVRVPPQTLPPAHAMPLDKLNQSLRDIYFGGDNPRNGPYNDTISISGPSGIPLLTMWNWSMAPNPAETDNSPKTDEGSHICATFDSPADEHYYGLGQQQQGSRDLRDHRIRCWHDYTSIGGETVCVPFMVVEPRLRSHLG
jgi:alpha-D-xyloside xylohydrolase